MIPFVLDLPEPLLRDLLTASISEEKELKAYVLDVLTREVSARDATAKLTDPEIDGIVEKLFDEAKKQGKGAEFQVHDLYNAAFAGSWQSVDPNVRKSIGKRFRKFIEAEGEARSFVHEDGRTREVYFASKNAQNQAIYKINEVFVIGSGRIDPGYSIMATLGLGHEQKS